MERPSPQVLWRQKMKKPQIDNFSNTTKKSILILCVLIVLAAACAPAFYVLYDKDTLDTDTTPGDIHSPNAINLSSVPDESHLSQVIH